MPQGTRGNPFSIEQRKQIAERLKTVRRSMRDGRGMIQAELAELVDVSHSHYSKCESGHNSFSARFLERVAARAGISATWLLSGTGPMREGEGAPPPAQNAPPSPLRTPYPKPSSSGSSKRQGIPSFSPLPKPSPKPPAATLTKPSPWSSPAAWQRRRRASGPWPRQPDQLPQLA